MLRCALSRRGCLRLPKATSGPLRLACSKTLPTESIAAAAKLEGAASALPATSTPHAQTDEGSSIARAGASRSTAAALPDPLVPPVGPIVLYRNMWVRSMRMVLRLKVLHLGVGLGAVFPISIFLLRDLASPLELGFLASLAGAAVVTGATMSWYCERIAQQISWRASERMLEVSTLTMWGARRDRYFGLEQIDPTYASSGPNESEVDKVLVPLNVFQRETKDNESHVSEITFLLLRIPVNVKEPIALARLLSGLPPFPPGEPQLKRAASELSPSAHEPGDDQSIKLEPVGAVTADRLRV